MVIHLILSSRMRLSQDEEDFRKGECSWHSFNHACVLYCISSRNARLINFLFPHTRESFALVKGAVLLVEEGEREGLQEETIPPLLGPRQGGQASDTQRRHLHAMISLLRPEDTVKLVRIPQTILVLLHCFSMFRVSMDVEYLEISQVFKIVILRPIKFGN